MQKNDGTLYERDGVFVAVVPPGSNGSTSDDTASVNLKNAARSRNAKERQRPFPP